jgi:hypothetical protein
MGAMAHTMSGVPLFLRGWEPNAADAPGDDENDEPASGNIGERIERLLVFLSAGLQAPPSSVELGTKKADASSSRQERIEVTK